MQLKTYQQTALEQLDRWIDALKEARLNSEKATDVLKKQKLDIPDELKKLSAYRMEQPEKARCSSPHYERRGNCSPRLHPPNRHIRRTHPACLHEDPHRRRQDAAGCRRTRTAQARRHRLCPVDCADQGDLSADHCGLQTPRAPVPGDAGKGLRRQGQAA